MTFDWTQYTGNLTWLQSRTIYMTVHGSRAYGTSLPTSDYDYRGIAIAPKDYYIGLTNNFEQAICKDPDLTIFELRKFLKLASDCNPNALEIIFTDAADHLVSTPLGDKLLANRDLFLSQRAKSAFQGYAHAQMKRILLHRYWLLNPPKAQPTRGDYGLPEHTVIPSDQLAAANAYIKKRLDEWSWHELEDVSPPVRQAIKDEFCRRLTEITNWGDEQVVAKTWRSAANVLGFSSNFIEVLNKERQYTNALKNWQQYQTWKQERNPARAEMEAKFGYDLKHGLHLVRLLRTCLELLTTGKLNVRRPDADELLAIRAGAWTFDHLRTWFEAQAVEIEEAAKNTKLPRTPNHKKIDQLCVELIEASWE